MKQPNEGCDRQSCQHHCHPGGLASPKAPSQWQQDQLGGDCGPPAPSHTPKDSPGDDEEQQPECGHQDRYPNPYHKARHVDLPDLQRGVRQRTECFDDQENCGDDDGSRALPS
jgi:hypothetical protein